MQRREFFDTVAGGMVACALLGGQTSVARAPKPTDVAAWISRRRYIATPAGRIAYVEGGRRKAALFVHGFPLNGFQWRGALDRLSGIRRCIAPDLLGLGFTEVAPGQSVAPAAQVEMLIELLDRLKIDAVDLVANDSGGAVAQLLLVAHPERVRTLLLTNCDAEPDSPPPALKPVLDMARAGTFAEKMLAPWAVDKALARSPTGLGGLTYTYPERLADETIDHYLKPLIAPDRQALTNAYAVALDPNPLAGIEAALKKSRTPARIVWGTGDAIFSPEMPDYLDRTFGNSRGVRRIPGAKLFWPEEFPELLAEEARALWT
ncbi:MAG: alpha/beta hydrolase [Steroidobacteraceae bacterium]|nr:alpha/beta hydrolase [Steroidobacteraceae bacterium]